MDYEWKYFVESLGGTVTDQAAASNHEVWKSLCCLLPEDVKKGLRDSLVWGFRGYREAKGDKRQALVHLLAVHTELCREKSWDNLLKRRHNALVYRYVVDIVAGNRAVAKKLNISKDTLYADLDNIMGDMMLLCVGLPYLLKGGREELQAAVKLTIKYYPLLDRVSQTKQCLCLFPVRIRSHIQTARTATEQFLCLFNQAIEIYSGFRRPCDDIMTERRMAVLKRSLQGHTGLAQTVAAEYCCSAETVYHDMRENQECICDLLTLFLKNE